MSGIEGKYNSCNYHLYCSNKRNGGWNLTGLSFCACESAYFLLETHLPGHRPPRTSSEPASIAPPSRSLTLWSFSPSHLHWLSSLMRLMMTFHHAGHAIDYGQTCPSDRAAWDIYANSCASTCDPLESASRTLCMRLIYADWSASSSPCGGFVVISKEPPPFLCLK